MATCKDCLHIGICPNLNHDTAADKCPDFKDRTRLVLVVRCKDCKHWRDTWVAPDGKHEHGYCHMEEADDVVVGRWGDDFCSYGERKDNG